jgi:hypothetical protein
MTRGRSERRKWSSGNVAEKSKVGCSCKGPVEGKREGGKDWGREGRSSLHVKHARRTRGAGRGVCCSATAAMETTRKMRDTREMTTRSS